MSVLKTEDFRQLPNSKWLRSLIECDRKDFLNIIKDERDEKVWQEDYKSYDEWDAMRKEELEMVDNVLTKCVKIKEGEPIYFTEKEWNWICGFFVGNTARYVFDTEGFTPWHIDENPNMANADHLLWLDSYNKYVEIVKREQEGFRFPNCGCRAGYECRFAYAKIDEKMHKRHTGNIHDDQECIDELLETDKNMKSVYEWISGYCPQCLVPYGGIHHMFCLYERCSICGGQFISCGHDRDVIYCKGLENDGLFHRGFDYWLTPQGKEIPISDRSERSWLRGFLEGVIDKCSISLNDPNFGSSWTSGRKLGIRADLLDDLEVAKDILIMLDQNTPTLTLTGDQVKKFEHVLSLQSLHLRECKKFIIAQNKKRDRYSHDPLQDDDYNYLIRDELKVVDKFLNIVSDKER
ncbi:MAG TPA: hypothetical protein VEL11_17530, partial [Candidatus Bathyarchaeia archaeon]|nr:hypothetical protein [Candidatus Bathyarchaeia archaeon]